MLSNVFKIGQLSDIHIGESEDLVQGIDVRANFITALSSSSMQNLDLLVLSGDLANENAEPGAYEYIANHIKKFPFPVCIIPGNHDKIEIMQKYFDLEVHNGKCYYKREFHNRTLFFIDSACGDVSKDQLEWLKKEIPSIKGEVLLFMHHPPCFCNHRFMDLRYYLKNMVEVQNVLSHFDNLTHVFCGHYHSEFEVQMGNQHVHVAPSTQMQIDPNTPYFSLKSSAPGWQVIICGTDFIETKVYF